MKILIITEKPSVALDVKRALGKFDGKKDFFENEQFIITWSLGHLVELFEPEDYDKKYKFWVLQNLPIIPEEFKLKVTEKTKSRFNVIKNLIQRKDVGVIVNACDAGREGEHIFRSILQLVPHSKKKIKRLWLSAMTEDEIIKEMKNLRDASEFDLLGVSAAKRSEGDWLVGINGTRAFTRRWGTLLSLGRVQTPTLNIICSREKEIKSFVKELYYELEGTFKNKSVEYKGLYVNDKGKSKMKDSNVVDEIIKKVSNKSGIVSNITRKESKTPHPLLYSLGDLQRDANKSFGYTALKTLNIAQRLYEERKLITYPRTNSRYLPSSLTKNLKNIFNGINVEPFYDFVKTILSRPLKLDSRVINDRGVTDHYAIIPTGVKFNLNGLIKDERNVFDLVVRRFIAAFMEDSIFEKLNLDTIVEGEIFKTNLIRIKSPGWMAVYSEREQKEFPQVLEGLVVKVSELALLEKMTQPPARFTDATLLSAMENAGKFVDEAELKEAMKEKGLGTSATRAAIIERLVEVGYIERVFKSIIPTDKGMRLVGLASVVGVEEVLSPTLTGEWEKKLFDIEKGKFDPDKFMKGIINLTKKIVDKVKKYEGNFSVNNGNSESIGKCPKCGGMVYETVKGFACENVAKKTCDFIMWKKLINKQITREMAVKLLQGETVQVEKLLSRYKTYYNAPIKLENGKVSFIFPERTKDEVINNKPIAKCPNCDGNIIEGKETYFCDNENCKFRMKKVMGNRLITREELKDLIEKKKTPLFTDFKSKKGKDFSAYLYIDKNGFVKFEFEKKKLNRKRSGFKRAKPTKK
ncbi:MAG: DNA topoisomerase III [Caldiserica bacterium]|nr:DNA topoisomerase III [Caldisericota bacterium]